MKPTFFVLGAVYNRCLNLTIFFLQYLECINVSVEYSSSIFLISNIVKVFDLSTIIIKVFHLKQLRRYIIFEPRIFFFAFWIFFTGLSGTMNVHICILLDKTRIWRIGF